MTILAIPNITFTDTLPWLIPVSGVIFGLLAYWKGEREKHKMNVDADVEKHKATANAEIQKAKENSVGGEAVFKIWTEFTKVNKDLEKVTECLNAEHTDKVLMMEIIKRLQAENDSIMKYFMEYLPKRHI